MAVEGGALDYFVSLYPQETYSGDKFLLLNAIANLSMNGKL
jgi:hypothetical protein